MEVYLVRHGIAEDPVFGKDDSLRKLTSEGIERTTKVAKAFRRHFDSVDLILHSPYIRALETAKIFSLEFPEVELKSFCGITPDGEPLEVCDFLEKFSKLKRVMVVSHEPFLGFFASYLLTGNGNASIPFKKAGICAMEWGGPGASSLLFMASPRILIG